MKPHLITLPTSITRFNGYKDTISRKSGCFGCDFRQTLPVVRSGGKEDFIREIFLYSVLWSKLKKVKLSQKNVSENRSYIL